MTDRVLIPGGNQWLALSLDAYHEALALGAKLFPQPLISTFSAYLLLQQAYRSGKVRIH